MTPDIVVAGHICLDLIPRLYEAAEVRPGRLVQVGPPEVSTGGAVANTGVALHRLGVPVRLIGKVGDDFFGGALLDVLRNRDPALASGMVISKSDATSYSIVISPPGVDRSFLHCPGANDTFSASDVDPAQLAGARVFHFGYPPLMRRMFADGGAELRALFDVVRGAGLATSLDLSLPDPASPAGRADWREIFGRVLPAVDLFLPSIDEVLLMLDRPMFERLSREPLASVCGLGELRRFADVFLSMGVAVVGLKLGDQGLYLRASADPSRIADFCQRAGLDAKAWEGAECISPCFSPAEIAGTTGSGDCTIAGFLAGVIRREGAAGAATLATAVGASSVEKVGATEGVTGLAELDGRRRAGWRRMPSLIRLSPGAHAAPDESGTLIIGQGC